MKFYHSVLYCRRPALAAKDKRNLRPPRRSFSWLSVGLPCLLVGGALFLLGRAPGVPGNGATVFYPAVLLYNYAAIPLALVILLVSSLLLVLWLPQAVRRSPRFASQGLALGLALAGAVLACWGSLPRALLADSYLHIDRAALGGRVYQLGVRLGLDGDNFYVLCQCSQKGILCRCRHLRPAGVPAFDERPELAADTAGQTLAIRVGEQVVWTGSPEREFHP